jgi:hypothetical protein
MTKHRAVKSFILFVISERYTEIGETVNTHMKFTAMTSRPRIDESFWPDQNQRDI